MSRPTDEVTGEGQKRSSTPTVADGKKSRSGCRWGCGAMVVVIILGLFLLYQFGSNIGSPSEEKLEDTNTVTTPSVKPTEDEETSVVTSPPPINETSPEESEQKEVAEEAGKLTEIIQETPQSEKILTRNYSWSYGGGDWNWEIGIPKALYKYYQEMPRPPTKNYSVYVTHPLDDVMIDILIGKIEAAASEEEYDSYRTVEFVTAFVQNLPYSLDSVTAPYDEYPRYPIETLVDNGGDCEDTSILLASLLDEMGYGVVLISLPDHMAVGIKGGENVFGTYWEYEGDRYYYIETTGTGWGIGQLPEVLEDTPANLYPLVPVPIITHEWDLEGEEFYLVLKVKVNNLGTATASDMYVFACFDAGDGTGWSSKQSDTFDLEPGHQVTATLGLLPPPPGVRTRLMVRIVMGGYRVDESYSVWVDT